MQHHPPPRALAVLPSLSISSLSISFLSSLSLLFSSLSSLLSRLSLLFSLARSLSLARSRSLSRFARSPSPSHHLPLSPSLPLSLSPYFARCRWVCVCVSLCVCVCVRACVRSCAWFPTCPLPTPGRLLAVLAALATVLLLGLAGNDVVGFSAGPLTGSCAPAGRAALAPPPAASVGVCAGRRPVKQSPRGLQRLRAGAGVYTISLPRRAVRHGRMRL